MSNLTKQHNIWHKQKQHEKTTRKKTQTYAKNGIT
jgi:hypothetical protein